jgi:hypothetical protein
MAKKKSGPGKRRNLNRTNKRNATIIGGGLLIVILITAVFLNRVMKMFPDLLESNRDKTEITTPGYEIEEPRITTNQESVIKSEFDQTVLEKFEPLIQSAKNIQSPSSIPSGYVIPGLDLNADGKSTKLIAMNNVVSREPSRSLKRNGFTRVASDIIILSEDIVLLHIDAFSIKNRDGISIIDQAPAPYGYAYRTSKVQNDETPFDSPISLIHIILLDQNGEGISDELTLYWHPKSNKFRATNTFGAPGTY